jgi:hypothetical protein
MSRTIRPLPLGHDMPLGRRGLRIVTSPGLPSLPLGPGEIALRAPGEGEWFILSVEHDHTELHEAALAYADDAESWGASAARIDDFTRALRWSARTISDA